MIQQKHELEAGRLRVKVYGSRAEMGKGAAHEVAERIRDLLDKQDYVNIIFAAAPSQSEFLACLSEEPRIPWTRINAFHMDEYIGLDQTNPESFAYFLKEAIFDRVPFHAVYFLKGTADDLEAECNRYSRLLTQFPADIVCMGIGENGHVAFNDPHVADFNDPAAVKTVDLDRVSRQQQVHDGCFATLAEVPASALTLTVPSLLKARYVYCVVPGSHKAQAVYHTLNSETKEDYPSTALRNHPRAVLYLDEDSASQLNP